MSLEAPTLTGRAVQLEQLCSEHVGALLAAGQTDRSTYTWTAVPADRESMHRYVDGLLADQRAGSVVPFVQRRLADGALVGCTRFMRLEWWFGRDVPDEVEVGGTWLAAGAQRSAINTEAKYLLLGLAFDAWAVQRVSLCTDARNQRSRDAIDRIGAQFEGILRSHRASYVEGEAGRLRDSAMFSITATDWPAVKTRLEGMLR